MTDFRINPARPSASSSDSLRQNKALTVSELNRQVKRLLEASYNHVWVSGELSSFARPGSGHWYFSLKDERAQIRCAMFKGFNQRLKFQPKEGDQIIIRAKASLYEGRGDYQLIVEDMEPAGLGQLQAAFEALKLKLSQEGLFDPAAKKALPKMARKVAVVTSATGAVIHDIITVCQKRFPALEIVLLPVRVQGDGAAQEVANAIEFINTHQLADVMIVGRGGGSLEDLWAFNEEVVARAIYASQIPVVSAVGHEVDYTIADLVADYRAATPSAAAEAITPDQYELMQHVDQQLRRLHFVFNNLLQHFQQRLNNNAQRLISPQQHLADRASRIIELKQRLEQRLKATLQYTQQTVRSQHNALLQFNPQQQLGFRQEHVANLQRRLHDGQQRQLNDKKHRLSIAAQTLHTASPLATLGRGYSITQNEQQEVIRSPAQVSPGDALTIRLQEGQLRCRVAD